MQLHRRPSQAVDLPAPHPYPCSFRERDIENLIEPNAKTFLDPFCGSGTSLLAAAREGRTAYGFDCNPIAILIAQFRTLKTGSRFFATTESVMSCAAPGLRALVLESNHKLHAFEGRDHWFSREAQSALWAILHFEQTLPPGEDVHTWYRLAISRIINRVSRQDSETRYVAREKGLRRAEIIDIFLESLDFSRQYLLDRGSLRGAVSGSVADSGRRIPLDDASVDCIVTSPPYANTMDYYLYHKQRMNVLGYDFKAAQNTEIGSRWEYSSLKRPLGKWEAQFRHSLSEMRRVLRPDSQCVLIIGDSQVAGKLVDAAAMTRGFADEIGFSCVRVDSVDMSERSRSFSRAFQRPHKKEHTIHLRAV